MTEAEVRDMLVTVLGARKSYSNHRTDGNLMEMRLAQLEDRMVEAALRFKREVELRDPPRKVKKDPLLP